MSRTVRLRGVVLGEGPAKIAAPMCGTSLPELLREAEAIAASDVDLAEWRLDHLLAARASANPPPDLPDLLDELRRRLGDLPLVATVRTAAEGGEIPLADDQYARLVQALVEAAAEPGRGPDAVDVEILRGSVLSTVAPRAREVGVVLVGSSHDFGGTPSRAAMLDLLERMAVAGADVVKLAVMAAGPVDVLELLAVTHEASTCLETPVVTMAMGPAGIVSRLAGEVFGSVLTFGSVGRASAPGQVDAGRLRDVVDLIHESGHTPTDIAGEAAPPRP